ncbi:MAG: bacterial translation initiation factor 2 (bIF-2) [Acidobacteriales bacterium]|nr:bacterial translation initiation factor 2 (bIF-2) [Terriglobales bacterium]
MSKVRINDLARELEVKSKAILDVLPKVGVTEKKTHSSSVEADEADRIRKFLSGNGGGGSKEDARGSSRSDEVKPKFDFSKISKPGDVLKAIKKPGETPAIAKVAPPAASATPAKPGAVTAKPVIAAPKPAAPAVEKPVAPKEEAPVIAKAAPVAPAPVEAPKKIEKPVVEEPVAAKAAPVAPVVEAPVAAPEAPAPAPTRSSAPPPRRLIVPQTGPRPVYSAPARPAAPPASASSPGSPTTGLRPQGGLPVRGQPIFQRPRPQAPGAGGPPGSGARAPFVPGQRRPMHPTRTAPTGGRPMGGPRPLGVGPGGPPVPGRPTARPAGPSRRPGQRYVPRGVKEGPMKGFAPPTRGQQVSNEPLPISRTITITEGISVKDLAEKLDVRAKDIIARLLMRGVMATVNQTLDGELAIEMARHFGADTNVISFEEQVAQDVDASMGPETVDTSVDGAQRPPVVTIMGHVDHGKTSLLDAIRETDVVGGEAGGITQHIGAYKVRIGKKDSPAYGREITFLDTPGHEAFTRMRARGAKVTDIVVLVVAADDGVMPQTLEAIDHAKAAKVPLIVAVNKIDKPDAMPDRVKKQLADRGLLPEDWGGTTVFVDVSAKQKTNLDLLLEMVCLVADVQGLKASPDRTATGSVVEAKLDRGRGAVATVLVQNGTLKTGDTFIVGNSFGKVRAMFDDRGNAVDSAPPSTPVEVLGLEGMPTAGDQFIVVADRDKAKTISHYREMKAREAQLAKSSRVSLEGLAEKIKNAGMKELPIILKGDVAGSVEVLADSLTKLSNSQVTIRVLHTGIGAITETDVLLASASNAIIIGFNVRPERKAQEIADQEQVDIRLHSIIYELQDEIRKAMTGLLEPIFKESYSGRAEVRNIFKVPKAGTVAGCFVVDGSIRRDAEVRLLRDNVPVFKGKIASLRRFKDDASEVRNGMECGIGIANYNDIKVGDVIEAFSVEKIAAELTA